MEIFENLPETAQCYAVKKLFGSKFSNYVNKLERWNFKQFGTTSYFEFKLPLYIIEIEIVWNECKTSWFSIISKVHKTKNGFDSQKIHHTAYPSRYLNSETSPICSICNRRLRIKIAKNKNEQSVTVENDQLFDESPSVFSRGHKKYHKKIAEEVSKFYFIAQPINEILGEFVFKLEFRQNTQMQRILIDDVYKRTVVWYSSLIFRCIWKYHREGTVLSNLPKDLLEMINGYILIDF